MKALLLSTYQNQSIAQHLLTGLRQRIGTCEYVALTQDEQENIERFFARSVRLSQFDRIVLEAPQEWIYQQSLFLRQLPYLSVLCLHGAYSAKEKRLLKRNLHVMPWTRFISVEEQLVHDLISKGYDSYWLRPMFNPSIYRPRRRLQQTVKCLIYDKNFTMKDMVMRQYPHLPIQFCEHEEELSLQLYEQDIFIYSPDEKLDFKIVIQALACGAIALMPTPIAEASLRYHWRDNKNSIFINGWSDALEKAQVLLRDEARRAMLLKHSAKLVERFTPDKVGEMLGAALEPIVRDSADYPRKTRIFGFEL